MKTPPENYSHYGGEGYAGTMSNALHTINKEKSEHIKGKPLFGTYPAKNFFGIVWYENDKWYCMAQRYRVHTDTFESDTLEGIMELACNKYGYE